MNEKTVNEIADDLLKAVKDATTVCRETLDIVQCMVVIAHIQALTEYLYENEVLLTDDKMSEYSNELSGAANTIAQVIRYTTSTYVRNKPFTATEIEKMNTQAILREHHLDKYHKQCCEKSLS